MRYLIVGDIHGNLPALEKVLKVEKNNYDMIICHGDVVNYGPWSNECVQLLASIPKAVTLRGNHEANYLIGTYSGENKVAKAFFEFCYPTFIEYDIIGKYREAIELEDFIVRHTIQDNYLFPDTDLSEFNINNNYIIGHSHYQFDRSWENFKVINTGSLGQNRKFIDVAEYVLFDATEKKVSLRSFNYNIDLVIEKMENEQYPPLCLNYYRNKKRNT